MLRHLLLLAAICTIAFAAVARMALETKPEEYTDCDCCWLSDIEECVPTGESRPVPNKCEQYKCFPTEVQIYSCGTVNASSSCTVTTDESQVYPGCCAQVSCPPGAVVTQTG